MRRPVLALVVLVSLALVAARALAAGGVGAVSTPPPTPVPPHASPSPFPTVLATPVPTLRRPNIGASSSVLEDLDTGQVLDAIRPDVARPIASLTKIMTAYLALHRLRPNRRVTVSAEAAQLGAHDVGISELGLRYGERLTVRQLLEALLLQSANDAAVALADAVSPTTDDFLSLMDRTAHTLGLGRTVFLSPNGLDDRGHSTARSLATLTRAVEHMPLFAKLVRTKFATVPAPTGVEPRHIQNRNVLLWLYPGAIGVKTGYTSKAGYCLVAAAKVGGQRLLTVILGDTSSANAFSDAAALLDYGFHSFLPEDVIEEGQRFTATADGLRYRLAATRTVRAWVVASARRPGSITVAIAPGTPPAPGSVAGTVTVRRHGLVLGTAPVRVTSVLGPARSPRPEHRQGPPVLRWWQRSERALGGLASDLYRSVFG